MKSRTSFFNATVLRKDITRFLPVWLIYLIGSLLIGLNNISATPDNYFGWGAKELAESIPIFGMFNFIYALICAQMLFGDLFKSRLCNALHAMPIRRESWFLTHTVAGIAFSLVPNFIMSLLYMPLMDGMWYISLLWLLAVTLSYLFFFGVAAFSAICSGNRLGMTAIYGIINFFALIANWFISNFYEPLLHGLHLRYDSLSLLCPTLYMTNTLDDLIVFEELRTLQDVHYGSQVRQEYILRYLYQGLSSHWLYYAAVAIAGIAALVLALVLYRKRKLECAGDFLAFGAMKPVFTVIFSLACGALGHSFDGSDLFLISGIVIGYFVCTMLMQRTVKVFRKKEFIKCGAMCAALLASILLTALDPLGITRWTPKPEQVDSVILSGNYYFDPDEWDSYQRSGYRVVENPDAIADLIEVHKQVMTEEISDSKGSISAIHLTYQMKDGRTIERRYHYHANGEAGKILDRFIRSPEYIMGYRDWDEYLSHINGAYLGWNSDQPLPREAAVALAKAIKADCESSNMAQTDRYDFAGSITLTFEDDSTLNIQYFESSRYILQWLNNYGKETPKGA